MANEIYEKLCRCYGDIKQRIPFRPLCALVLGSGLGDYADEIGVSSVLDYHDISGFPISTVPGHKGRYVFAYVEKVPVVIMQGRVHYYEGYSIADVVLPVRLMKMMGARFLLLTNAAGGVNYDFKPGDFMMITDQISSFVPSPLTGENIEELGVRFPDMSEIYDRDLQKLIRKTAKDLDIPLREGVYMQLTGPNYESPAEVRMVRILGGDAVGMSTACEAVAANHMGMKIAGISCISNLACGMTAQPLSHSEVQIAAQKAAPLFKKLISGIIAGIGIRYTE